MGYANQMGVPPMTSTMSAGMNTTGGLGMGGAFGSGLAGPYSSVQTPDISVPGLQGSGGDSTAGGGGVENGQHAQPNPYRSGWSPYVNPAGAPGGGTDGASAGHPQAEWSGHNMGQQIPGSSGPHSDWS